MISLNLIHFSPYEYGLDLEALLVFGLGSFVIISILLFYYNRIPKSNQPNSHLQNPLYQTSDILLQSNSREVSFVIPEKTSSPLVKLLIYDLIAIVVFTPLYQLLGVEYFI